MSIIVNSSTL